MAETDKVDLSVVCIGTKKFTDLLSKLAKSLDAAIGGFNQLAKVSTVPNNWLKMHGEPMVRKRAYARIKS